MKKIIFFIFLIPQFTSAQIKQKESYTVYVNYPDYTIKTDIYAKSKKINVKEKVTYYWYSSNKIMETTGGYDGKILNGAYTSFYNSGNLKEKGMFKNGTKNGEWINWYENGKLKEINSWKSGVKSNSSRSFNLNGELISESRYKKGKLNGYQITYMDGKTDSKKKYKNGTEVIKKQKKSTKETSSEKSGNKVSKKYKIVKEWLESVFHRKADRKKRPAKEKIKKHTITDRPKNTTEGKAQSLLKKKDTSEKLQKNMD